MKSPFFVVPSVNEYTGKPSWILQRDDGRAVYKDGDFSVTAIEYRDEHSAIDALQKYIREYYELELVHRQTEEDRINSLFSK